MKYIHTFGTGLERAFIEVSTITKYCIDMDKVLTSIRKDKFTYVRVVAHVGLEEKFVLTPNVVAGDNYDILSLQKFIVELIKTITTTPDGSILRCYTPENEWGIVVDGVRAQ